MNDFLMHYGVQGQKWGIRRYQNYDGTRIKSGKTVEKSESSNTAKETKGLIATVKNAKAAKEQKRVDKESAQIDAEKAELKAKILENPTAETVYKNRNLFTNDELKNLTARFQTVAALKEQSDKEKAKSEGFVKQVLKVSGKKIVSDVLPKAGEYAFYKASQKLLGEMGVEFSDKNYFKDTKTKLTQEEFNKMADTRDKEKEENK